MGATIAERQHVEAIEQVMEAQAILHEFRQLLDEAERALLSAQVSLNRSQFVATPRSN